MKRLVKAAVQSLVARTAPVTWRFRDRSLLVLMYHRVLPRDHTDRNVEQPGMYVSPETLRMHIDTLRENFTLVHLDEWVRNEVEGGANPARACALTFDDGWRDNFDHAFPILRETGAPATIFLVSTLIGTDAEFWPNRLSRLLATGISLDCLPPKLAATLRPLATSHAHVSGYDADEAICLAKGLGDAEMNELLDKAEQGIADSAGRRAVMNEQEVLSMAASGLIRFGSHTRTHYRCRPGAPRAELEREIRDSRAEISATLGQSTTLFCYPNGDTTPEAVDVVRHHYDAAVTTVRGWYRPGADRYLIPRVGVHEDISSRRDAFLARISCWM